MDISFSEEGGKVVARLSGRFDYTTYSQFLAQADRTLANVDYEGVVVDMTSVEYIDSSALGMLLMLRDRVRKDGKAVVLANLRGFVREVIEKAQFPRLFQIV